MKIVFPTHQELTSEWRREITASNERTLQPVTFSRRWDLIVFCQGLAFLSLLQHKMRHILINKERYATGGNHSRQVRLQSFVKASPPLEPAIEFFIYVQRISMKKKENGRVNKSLPAI